MKGDRGFNEAKRVAVAALQSGLVTYEPRDLGKNALADGSISYREAAAILERTRGNQAKCQPHHFDSRQLIWIFRPEGWYIKFYLVDGVCFLSFHLAEGQA